MTIGARIKERRKELGLSADEVANRLSKNRATVYRYENDDIENLPTSVLIPLSEILHTTPSYLMGWTNDPNIPDNNITNTIIPERSFDEDINPDIRMIARAGKKMTSDQAELLRKYAEFMFPEAFKESD